MKRTVWYALTIIGISIIYFANLFLDMMDIDATQYAAMSFEMIERNQFLTFTDRYHNYLDKPPLLFWLASSSYRLFGIANWSYKLPSLLFALLGIYATFRFAGLYYDRATARLAAFMLATTQALFLITNDVRTDTILMGAVIFSLWQLGAYLQTRKTHFFVGAFVGIGLAMLAKGPIGLVMAVLAFGPHLLLKSWRDIFRPQWLLGLVVVALVLAPMCVGLYLQFDANPNVEVNGQKGVSGLYFYFWKQSFGRITGESEWKNDSDPFFFVHTFAWSFLPWTVFALGALADRIRELVRKGAAAVEEVASLSGFLLPWIALSLSHYKLPHYIYVFFPLAAVLTAQYMVRLFRAEGRTAQVLAGVQWGLMGIVWGVPALLLAYVFPNPSLVVVLAVTGVLGVWAAVLLKARQLGRMYALVLASGLTMIGVNVAMTFHFYPHLLEYQSSAVAGRYAFAHGWKPEHFMGYKGTPHSLDVYARQINRGIYETDTLHEALSKHSPVYLYGIASELDELRADTSFIVSTVMTLPHYHVSMLPAHFFSPQTRDKKAEKRQIVQISHRDTWKVGSKTVYLQPFEK